MAKSRKINPLEVLRISTVVDHKILLQSHHSFGSAKNFYCCRSNKNILELFPFGSAKNFYCCRFFLLLSAADPLEVLRISTVVDRLRSSRTPRPLEVLRISTVVDLLR